MLEKVLSLLLGVGWGVLLTLLSIGIWQHFDNNNWGSLSFGLLILVPTIPWLVFLED